MIWYAEIDFTALGEPLIDRARLEQIDPAAFRRLPQGSGSRLGGTCGLDERLLALLDGFR